MKYISILISLTFLTVMKVNASNIREVPIYDIEDQDGADEAAKIINQNFQELYSTKVDVSVSALSEPTYFVSELLDPEMSDYNCMAIMENADDLWRNKTAKSGISGSRNYSVADLTDKDLLEENIEAINQIFYELDTQLSETGGF